MKYFKTERGLASHFDKSSDCAQAFTKVLQCLPTHLLSNPLVHQTQTKLKGAPTADASNQNGNASNAAEIREQQSDTNSLLLFNDAATDEADLLILLESDNEAAQTQ